MSNFNLSSSEDFVLFSFPSTVCNTTSSRFYSLSLVYTELSITVTIGELGSSDRAQIVLDTPTIGLNSQLSFSVGNIPCKLHVLY